MGVPVAYLATTSAEATVIGKRTHTLQLWSAQIAGTLGISPSTIHLDKDLAEIQALKHTWLTAQIRLCLWHAKSELQSSLTSVLTANSAHQFSTQERSTNVWLSPA